MPRKKISLEEAFDVFTRHGLRVEVKAVESQETTPVDNVADFLVAPPQVVSKPRKVGTETMRITLRTKQTVSSGGHMVVQDGAERVTGQKVMEFGPGVCYVPTYLAGQLLHQDQLAIEYDKKLMDPTFRQYLVVPRRGGGSIVNVGIEVDDLNLGAAHLRDMYFV